MDKGNEILHQNIEDRIDAFIRGMMTEAEEAAFREEIKSKPELRAQVLATVSLIKGIRTQNAKKEKELIQNNTKDRLHTLGGHAQLQPFLRFSLATRKTSDSMNYPASSHPTIQSTAWMTMREAKLILSP